MQDGAGVDAWFELLDRLGDAVTVIDDSWHYKYVSPGAAAALGRSVEDLVGAYVWSVFPEVVGTPEQEAALQSMQTGEPVDIVWYYGRHGRWFEQRTVPTRAGMVVLVNDVTDREVARRRAERLVEVGQALARTMSYTEVQTVVSRDVLPLVGAAGGSIAIAERGKDVLAFLGWVGVDSEPASRWREVPLHVETPSTHAVRTGQPVWLDDPKAAAERFPLLAQELSAVAGGVAALPLPAAGEIVGSLSLLFPRPGSVSAPDRSFLSTVAAMCAQALTRARLLDLGTRTVDELQRHLLPRELPTIAGIELAVRYVPAETGMAIGGDWYDVVALPTGAVALVMGDVEGHDLGAAALMGLVRSALRAYLIEEHPPSVAVARMNTFLAGLSAERMVTVAVIHLHPGERLLTSVSAGHPTAMVSTPGGEVRDVPTDVGPPLGVYDDGMLWPETTSALPAGAVVTMFTDGLVEQRDADISVGVERVRRTLTEYADRNPEELVEQLLSGRPRASTDDVAVLVAKSDRSDREVFEGRLTRRLPPRPVSVTLARRFVRQLLAAWSIPDESAGDVEIAVSELVTNAARASEEPFELALVRSTDGLRIEVSDSSHQQPRLVVDEDDEQHTEGRGLQLVDALASRWGVQINNSGKTVWCEFDLPR